MNQPNSTTHHKESKHRYCEERVIIQTRLKDNIYSNTNATELNCSYNTK